MSCIKKYQTIKKDSNEISSNLTICIDKIKDYLLLSQQIIPLERSRVKTGLFLGNKNQELIKGKQRSGGLQGCVPNKATLGM